MFDRWPWWRITLTMTGVTGFAWGLVVFMFTGPGPIPGFLLTVTGLTVAGTVGVPFLMRSVATVSRNALESGRLTAWADTLASDGWPRPGAIAASPAALALLHPGDMPLAAGSARIEDANELGRAEIASLVAPLAWRAGREAGHWIVTREALWYALDFLRVAARWPWSDIKDVRREIQRRATLRGIVVELKDGRLYTLGIEPNASVDLLALAKLLRNGRLI